MLEDQLTRILRALNLAGVRYLVVGGVAVAAHGYVRFTADLDLVVALDTANAAACIAALDALGYRPQLPIDARAFADEKIRAHWAAEKDMQMLQLVSDQNPETSVELFIRAPFEFHREYATAPRVELLPGTVAPVVSYPTLLAMKETAGRPLDLDDIAKLKRARQSGAGH